jgi:predicted nucleotidyltransferase
MGQVNATNAISEATRRIADALNPHKIYLFGSHAWGVPTPDSDIDLFVIVKDSDQPSYKRSRTVYRSLRGMREPIEILVRTIDEVENEKSVVTSLTRKVLEQGKLLYE